MACIACGAVSHAPTVGWNVGELCSVDYATIAARYNMITDSNLLSDVIKAHTLIQINTALCMTKLGDLAAQQTFSSQNIPNNAPPTGDPRFAKVGARGATYLKLSRALEYYEGYCWFPANRTLLGGLLSADDFFKSVKLGQNKDPGAGKMHGDQSHRIQWHVLMRVMTNDFTVVRAPGWHHSPLSLFFHLTQRQGVIWGLLLDSQGNRGWGNPDNVKVAVLTSGHANLAEAISRRATKMGGATIALPNAGAANFSPRETQLQNSYIALVGAGTIINSGGLFEKIVLQIYTWEKYKLSPPTAHNTPVKAAALAVYNHATAAAPNLFGLKGNYKKIGTNLLQKNDAPDKDVKIDRRRVDLSMQGFNVAQYGYNMFGGAYPRITSRY